MKAECPICTIPEREELLYSDEDIFLVKTKFQKGHKHRVMACIYEHRKEPTFIESRKAQAIVTDYMNRVMEGEEWLLVASTFGSIPEHWHLMAETNISDDQKEMELMAKTATVTMPILTYNVMIGIPAFEEEKNIGEVVSKAKEYGTVVVIDDCSTDNTAKNALDAGAQVITLRENGGYGNALAQLFAEAVAYDVLITLDGDGQHNPDEIPAFLRALKNADMITGNRFMGKTDIPSYRSAGVEVISSLVGMQDSQCGFRAYNKKAIRTIKITERGMGASLEILRRAKENELIIREVPCIISYESAGHSQNPIKQGLTLLATFLWGNMWEKPVWMLGIPSLACLGIGTVFSILLLLEYSAAKWFAPSLAFISLGGLMMGALLGISAVFILVGKKLLEELR